MIQDRDPGDEAPPYVPLNLLAEQCRIRGHIRSMPVRITLHGIFPPERARDRARPIAEAIEQLLNTDEARALLDAKLRKVFDALGFS